MFSRGRLKNGAAVLLVALCLSAVIGGCGGEPPETCYVITVDSVEVGSASVLVEKTGDRITYHGTERRPFLTCDTTRESKLTVSSDYKTLLGYTATRHVPGESHDNDNGGASYGINISVEGDDYSFMDDDLQVFEYVPELYFPRGFLPFEADSPCLLQALLDRFLASGLPDATALVIIPSRSSVFQDLSLRHDGEGRVKLEGGTTGEIELSYDGGGLLLEVAGSGGLEIRKGSAGSMDSKPYAPTEDARKVREVTVPTADGLELAGSLYFPRGEKPYPAVVLAGEFGPQDRTGGGFLSQVADHLAGEGMAVLTCDKRGIPESEGHYGTYTLGSAAGDLDSQIDYLVLRGDIDIDRISVVGYGEGGTVVGRAAAANPYVTTCALMATLSVRLFPDLARVNIEREAASGELMAQEAEAAERQVSALEWVLGQVQDDWVGLGGRRLFLGWMHSQQDNNPLGTIASLKMPVLVMQGGRDQQVPASQALEIMDVLGARENGEEELVLFEELGHEFGRFIPEEEARPYRAHPLIEDEVLGTLSRWLKERK